MGKRRGPYLEEFPVGTTVQVVGRDSLDAFRRDWKWHHPLEKVQLAFANQTARVTAVSFYHGGDELYELEGIPGTWHEACLIGRQ